MQEAKDVIPDTIPGEDKLILYGLFKQATVGDINTARPGIFDQKGMHTLAQCIGTQAACLTRQVATSGTTGRSKRVRVPLYGICNTHHASHRAGKSKEQAMEEYIAKVEQLKEKYC